MTEPLSPSPRTTVHRGRNRARTDRVELRRLLAEALVAHLAVDVGTYPLVMPVAFGVDPDGPDDGGTLYVHGSVAARWLADAVGSEVSVAVTLLDGLVAARSGFHHSMNYRSAVIIGRTRLVDDPDEKVHALDLVVDQMIPGRSATLRPHTRKELAATAVLALPLHEASLKARGGDPVDDQEDVAAGTWAGVVPLRLVADTPVSAADSHHHVPEDVAAVDRASPRR